MIKVVKHNAESIDRLLRRFKRSCNNAGIVSDYKENRFYIKESEEGSVIKRRLTRAYEKARRRKSSMQNKRHFKSLSNLVDRREPKSSSLRRPG